MQPFNCYRIELNTDSIFQYWQVSIRRSTKASLIWGKNEFGLGDSAIVTSPFYMKGKNMEPLHDVNGAARILAVSPWTVRAYIRTGKLRAVRLGRLVRPDPRSIQEFVESQRLGVTQVDSKEEKER
jgi:excisionase family DNA binding protein